MEIRTSSVEQPPGGPNAGVTISERGPWRLTAEWAVINGRLDPASVLLTRTDDVAVSADAIRKLPIGALIDAGRQHLRDELLMARRRIEQAIVGTDPAELARPGSLVDVLAVFDHSAAPVVASSGPQRGRELSTDDLDEVVTVYRNARFNGDPVNEAVRTAFTLSKDGAAKRIMAARRMLRERGEEL